MCRAMLARALHQSPGGEGVGGGGAGASLCPRALSGRALAPRGHNTYIRKRILTYTLVFVTHWCAAHDARRRGWRAAPDGAHRAWCVMHERPLASADREPLDRQEYSTRAWSLLLRGAARRGRQTAARARGPRIRIGASCGGARSPVLERSVLHRLLCCCPRRRCAAHIHTHARSY